MSILCDHNTANNTAYFFIRLYGIDDLERGLAQWPVAFAR